MGTHSQVLQQLRSHPVEKGRDSICLAPQSRTSAHRQKGLGKQILLHLGVRALQGECPAVKGQRSKTGTTCLWARKTSRNPCLSHRYDQQSLLEKYVLDMNNPSAVNQNLAGQKKHSCLPSVSFNHPPRNTAHEISVHLDLGAFLSSACLPIRQHRQKRILY